jgi:hypothetical protein
VPKADSPDIKKVTNSDKPDNKLNNKLIEMDTDLTVVIEAWPTLPSAICSAIVAIVRNSNEQ